MFIFLIYFEEIYVFCFIKFGVVGYVLKMVFIKVFLKVLKCIVKGGIFFNEEFILIFISRNVGELSVISCYKKLLFCEIEVLNLLLSGKCNKDIVNVFDINEKMVSIYKIRLLKKFKVDNLVDLIN